jgi:hypothetical protein
MSKYDGSTRMFTSNLSPRSFDHEPTYKASLYSSNPPGKVEVQPLRVLVCGGRGFDNGLLVESVLDTYEIGLLIHGDAPGADTLAGKYAVKRGVPVSAFPADWKRLRNAAGPIRNLKMLREGRPDVVVAFPGGPGTANMVAIALAHGVRVHKVVEVQL